MAAILGPAIYAIAQALVPQPEAIAVALFAHNFATIVAPPARPAVVAPPPTMQETFTATPEPTPDAPITADSTQTNDFLVSFPRTQYQSVYELINPFTGRGLILCSGILLAIILFCLYSAIRNKGPAAITQLLERSRRKILQGKAIVAFLFAVLWPNRNNRGLHIFERVPLVIAAQTVQDTARAAVIWLANTAQDMTNRVRACLGAILCLITTGGTFLFVLWLVDRLLARLAGVDLVMNDFMDAHMWPAKIHSGVAALWKTYASPAWNHLVELEWLSSSWHNIVAQLTVFGAWISSLQAVSMDWTVPKALAVYNFVTSIFPACWRFIATVPTTTGRWSSRSHTLFTKWVSSKVPDLNDSAAWIRPSNIQRSATTQCTAVGAWISGLLAHASECTASTVLSLYNFMASSLSYIWHIIVAQCKTGALPFLNKLITIAGQLLQDVLRFIDTCVSTAEALFSGFIACVSTAWDYLTAIPFETRQDIVTVGFLLILLAAWFYPWWQGPIQVPHPAQPGGDQDGAADEEEPFPGVVPRRPEDPRPILETGSEPPQASTTPAGQDAITEPELTAQPDVSQPIIKSSDAASKEVEDVRAIPATNHLKKVEDTADIPTVMESLTRIVVNAGRTPSPPVPSPPPESPPSQAASPSPPHTPSAGPSSPLLSPPASPSSQPEVTQGGQETAERIEEAVDDSPDPATPATWQRYDETWEIDPVPVGGDSVSSEPPVTPHDDMTFLQQDEEVVETVEVPDDGKALPSEPSLIPQSQEETVEITEPPLPPTEHSSEPRVTEHDDKNMQKVAAKIKDVFGYDYKYLVPSQRDAENTEMTEAPVDDEADTQDPARDDLGDQEMTGITPPSSPPFIADEESAMDIDGPGISDLDVNWGDDDDVQMNFSPPQPSATFSVPQQNPLVPWQQNTVQQQNPLLQQSALPQQNAWPQQSTLPQQNHMLQHNPLPQQNHMLQHNPPPQQNTGLQQSTLPQAQDLFGQPQTLNAPHMQQPATSQQSILQTGPSSAPVNLPTWLSPLPSIGPDLAAAVQQVRQPSTNTGVSQITSEIQDASSDVNAQTPQFAPQPQHNASNHVVGLPVSDFVDDSRSTAQSYANTTYPASTSDFVSTPQAHQQHPQSTTPTSENPTNNNASLHHKRPRLQSRSQSRSPPPADRVDRLVENGTGYVDGNGTFIWGRRPTTQGSASQNEDVQEPSPVIDQRSSSSTNWRTANRPVVDYSDSDDDDDIDAEGESDEDYPPNFFPTDAANTVQPPTSNDTTAKSETGEKESGADRSKPSAEELKREAERIPVEEAVNLTNKAILAQRQKEAGDVSSHTFVNKDEEKEYAEVLDPSAISRRATPPPNHSWPDSTFEAHVDATPEQMRTRRVRNPPGLGGRRARSGAATPTSTTFDFNDFTPGTNLTTDWKPKNLATSPVFQQSPATPVSATFVPRPLSAYSVPQAQSLPAFDPFSSPIIVPPPVPQNPAPRSSPTPSVAPAPSTAPPAAPAEPAEPRPRRKEPPPNTIGYQYIDMIIDRDGKPNKLYKDKLAMTRAKYFTTADGRKIVKNIPENRWYDPEGNPYFDE